MAPFVVSLETFLLVDDLVGVMVSSYGGGVASFFWGPLASKGILWGGDLGDFTLATGFRGGGGSSLSSSLTVGDDRTSTYGHPRAGCPFRGRWHFRQCGAFRAGEGGVGPLEGLAVWVGGVGFVFVFEPRGMNHTWLSFSVGGITMLSGGFKRDFGVQG